MKSIKNLLIPAIIFLCLIIGLIIYLCVAQNDDLTTETTSDSLSVALELPSQDIVSLSVDNRDGDDYTIALVPDADGVSQWTFDAMGQDDSGYTYSESVMSEFVYIMSSFTYKEIVSEDTSKYDQYGLTDPDVVLTITLADSTVRTISFGDMTPTKDYTYVIFDGAPTVYTVPVLKATYCHHSIIDFLEMSITAIDESDVLSFGFERMSDNLDMMANRITNSDEDGSSNSSLYQVTSPVNIQASAYFGNMVTKMIALSASGFVDIPAEEYADYGLENPEYQFEIVLAGGRTIDISLSAAIGGYYYGISNAAPVPFKVESTSITGLEMPFLQLIEGYVHYTVISKVQSIHVSLPEGQFDMTMDMEDDQQISNENAEVQIDMRNGKVYSSSGRSYFALLYESIACMQISDFDFDVNPENNSQIQIVITSKEYVTTTIELSERDDSTYYVFIDGSYSGLIVNKSVIYKDNGSDLHNYGVWDAYVLLKEALDNKNNNVYDRP